MCRRKAGRMDDERLFVSVVRSQKPIIYHHGKLYNGPLETHICEKERNLFPFFSSKHFEPPPQIAKGGWSSEDGDSSQPFSGHKQGSS